MPNKNPKFRHMGSGYVFLATEKDKRDWYLCDQPSGHRDLICRHGDEGSDYTSTTIGGTITPTEIELGAYNRGFCFSDKELIEFGHRYLEEKTSRLDRQQFNRVSPDNFEDETLLRPSSLHELQRGYEMKKKLTIHLPTGDHGVDPLDCDGKIELVKKLKKYLGAGGKDFFTECLNLTGTVSPVLTEKQQVELHLLEKCSSHRGIPHPVHLREGMQVRNFLRRQKECKDWTDHDFDNRWVALVKEAIK